MYVVAGVSGQTGAATANALLQAGHRVKVLVRRAEAGAAWAARGAEVAVVDLLDAASLTRALQGAQGAFLLSPPQYGKDDPFAAARRLGEVFAETLAAAKLPRAVVLSSVGGHLPEGTGIIRTTHEVEAALADSRTPITFVRASFFMENWLHVLSAVKSDGVLPTFLAPLDRRIEMVSVADIGATAAAVLTGPAWAGRKVIELGGSQVASPDDVAAAMSKVLGRTITPIAVPREQWAGILGANGFSAGVVAAFERMYEGINNGTVRWESDTNPAAATRRSGTQSFQEAVAALF